MATVLVFDVGIVVNAGRVGRCGACRVGLAELFLGAGPAEGRREGCEFPVEGGVGGVSGDRGNGSGEDIAAGQVSSAI
ncbi:hypothetical protein ACQP2P_44240 [Dactylosporangium sp. CA-139114]|uniref:hypothetical protein n=1 Tax=Dactylosporangium sp. CA-139114 TaxID=3239931 RepID=UPI003D98DF33